MTKVFVSYLWEDDEHKEWVRSLTDKLLALFATPDRQCGFVWRSVVSADFKL